MSNPLSHPPPLEREGGGLETTDECEVVDLKRLGVKPGEGTGSESWGATGLQKELPHGGGERLERLVELSCPLWSHQELNYRSELLSINLWLSANSLTIRG